LLELLEMQEFFELGDLQLEFEAVMALVGGSFGVDVFRKRDFFAEEDGFLHFSILFLNEG